MGHQWEEGDSKADNLTSGTPYARACLATTVTLRCIPIIAPAGWRPEIGASKPLPVPTCAQIASGASLGFVGGQTRNSSYQRTHLTPNAR